MLIGGLQVRFVDERLVVSSNDSLKKSDLERISRLRLLIVRLERRIRQQSDTDLTPSQLSALTVIERRGPLRLGELAKRERISQPSVSRVVRKIEAKGLVALSGDPVDKRGSVVSVTPEGQGLIDESRGRVDAYLADAMMRLDEDDRHKIFEALPVLEEMLEKDR